MSGDWPGGSRGALCLSFDNLGEAAEIGAGAVAADAPGVGSHPTATEVLPRLLDRLERSGLSATFFVEGLNAELYPGLLKEIDARGHEVAYHTWTHEQWGELSPGEQADDLARGRAAFERLGLRMHGMRPPGGALGEGGLGAIRNAGLAYGSPAGAGASADGGLAVLPFQWRHVDATCLLPPLGAVREQITGSPDPMGPDRFLTHLVGELDRLAREGGFATAVLHPITIDAWLGESRLGALLDRVAAAKRSNELWVVPCREVARHVLANADAFAGGTSLDPTTWSA